MNNDYENIGSKEFEKICRESCSQSNMNDALENEDKLNDMVTSGPLEKFARDLKTLMNMVKDYVSGAYRAVPVGTIMAAVGTVAYVVSPVDAIPDFIPFVGLLDDAAVIAACLQLVRSDINEYRQWRASRKQNQLLGYGHSG